MSTFINTYSYVIHPDTGLPLVNGSIYFGNVGENPLHEPLPVYLEDGTPIPSPVRLGAGGVCTYNGHPVQVYVHENAYSVAMYDKRNQMVYESGLVSFNTLGEQDTSPLNQFREFGVPLWDADISTEHGYDIGVRVLRDGGIYESSTYQNRITPPGAGWTPVDITAYNSRIRAHSFVGEIAEFSISKDTLPLGWLALDGTTYTGGEDRYSNLVDVNSFFVRTNDNSPDLVAPGDILLLEMPDFLRAIGSTHNRVGGVIVDQEPTVQAWPDTMPDHYHDIDKRSLLFTTDGQASKTSGVVRTGSHHVLDRLTIETDINTGQHAGDENVPQHFLITYAIYTGVA